MFDITKSFVVGGLGQAVELLSLGTSAGNFVSLLRSTHVCVHARQRSLLCLLPRYFCVYCSFVRSFVCSFVRSFVRSFVWVFVQACAQARLADMGGVGIGA